MKNFLGNLGQRMPKKITYQYATIIAALVLVGQLTSQNISLDALSSRVVDNMASVVGMGAAVLPNETSTMAQALENKETELNLRELAIDAREREIRAVVLEEAGKQNHRTLLVIAGITLCLLALIGMNFYYDRRRGRAATSKEDAATKKGPHAHEGEFQTRL